MTHVSTILHALGFVESEIKTYLSSMELGAATVIELTKKTRLSRQATYVAIEALTERGLMASIVKGKKRYYVAEDPEKLASYAKRREQEMKEKLEDLNKILPELKLRAHGEKPIVKMFEGKDGIKAILSDIENSKPKHMMSIADMVAVKSVLSSEDTKPFREALLKNKTHVDYIMGGSVPAGEAVTNRIILPEKYSDFHSEVMIVDDKVVLATFEGKMNSIIIESKPLAKTLSILFELAIEKLREGKK